MSRPSGAISLPTGSAKALRAYEEKVELLGRIMRQFPDLDILQRHAKLKEMLGHRKRRKGK